MVDVEKIDAEIEDARIQSVYDLWIRKPPGIRFCDTDVLTITARTESGEEISDRFFFSLKPNGTFFADSQNSVSRLRRRRLVEFLRYYHFTESIKKYNIRKGIEDWKGKKVEVVKANGKCIFPSINDLYAILKG